MGTANRSGGWGGERKEMGEGMRGKGKGRRDKGNEEEREGRERREG